jgi:PKD repeat protein
MQNRPSSALIRRFAAAGASALALLLAPPLARAAPAPSFTMTPSANTYIGPISFDASATAARPDATYTWDFGNGQRTAPTPGGVTVTEDFDTPGTYTVTLTVSDATGTTSAQQQLTVSWAPPSASFTIDGYEQPYSWAVKPAQTVTFKDTSSSGNALLSSWVWDFGDGSSARGTSVSHVYAHDGAYQVTETVADTHGMSSQVTYRLLVDTAPSASFRLPARPLAGQRLTFDAGVSRPAGAAALTDYSWDFGDGSADYYGDGTSDFGAKPLATHTFDSPGMYEVTLYVTDAAGLSSQQTRTVNVRSDIASENARSDFAYELGRLSPFAGAFSNPTRSGPNPNPVCPQTVIDNDGTDATCDVEFESRGVRYFVIGSVSPRQDENALSAAPRSTGTILYARHWKPNWRASSRGCARRVPGKLSSNDAVCYSHLIQNFFDWGGQVSFKFKRHVYIMGAGSAYFPQWNTLTCRWSRSTYECTNAFGDGFRWRPYAR